MSSVILEDEFRQIYTYHESKFNIDFPITKIGIPSNSTLVFSNRPIGVKGMKDSIKNEESEILSLTYSELIDRLKISNVKSVEVVRHSTTKRWFEKIVIVDPDYMTWKDWCVLIGIVVVLFFILYISFL